MPRIPSNDPRIQRLVADRLRRKLDEDLTRAFVGLPPVDPVAHALTYEDLQRAVRRLRGRQHVGPQHDPTLSDFLRPFEDLTRALRLAMHPGVTIEGRARTIQDPLAALPAPPSYDGAMPSCPRCDDDDQVVKIHTDTVYRPPKEPDTVYRTAHLKCGLCGYTWAVEASSAVRVPLEAGLVDLLRSMGQQPPEVVT